MSRAGDIAEAAAVIRDLLESRGLLDARLEVDAALEGASEEDSVMGNGREEYYAPRHANHVHGMPSMAAVWRARDAEIPERTLRLTAVLAWRILEREAGR